MEHPVANKCTKGLIFLTILAVVIFSGGVIYKSKDDKSWSTWLNKQIEPEKVTAQAQSNTSVPTPIKR